MFHSEFVATVSSSLKMDLVARLCGIGVSGRLCFLVVVTGGWGLWLLAVVLSFRRWFGLIDN